MDGRTRHLLDQDAAEWTAMFRRRYEVDVALLDSTERRVAHAMYTDLATALSHGCCKEHTLIGWLAIVGTALGVLVEGVQRTDETGH